MLAVARIALTFGIVAALTGAPATTSADEGHPPEQSGKTRSLEELRDEHREHEHGHDFEAMAQLSPEQRARISEFMRDIGIDVPPMDSARGRKLFVETGCVMCHVVNGVGREVGPALDASEMPSPMNAFEFAARMWRGAAAMAALQEEELGSIIPLTGEDLADLIAFAHDADEQKKLTKDQIPEKFRKKLAE